MRTMDFIHISTALQDHVIVFPRFEECQIVGQSWGRRRIGHPDGLLNVDQRLFFGRIHFGIVGRKSQLAI